MENSQSLTDISELVENLYSGADPQEIARLQDHLQGLQRSTFGWQMAAHLIQSDSPHCQFFGALTYTVKISNYTKLPSSTTPETKLPSDLLHELLSALVHLNAKPEVQPHVLRKILSTLSRFFTKFPDDWHECIASTISAIASKDHLTESSHSSLETLCHDLSERNTILCLEFCQVLIEDVKNANLEPSEESKLDAILNKNILPLSILLRYASEVLYPQAPQNTALLESTFKTYGAWALNHPMATEYIYSLMPVTNYIFSYIQHHPDTDLYHIALEEISEILNRFPSFYDEHTKTLLARILGNTGSPMIASIEKKIAQIAHSPEPYIYDNDDYDIEQLQENAQSFSKAAMAVCELAMSDIDDLKSSEISTLIDYLLVISNFPGFPYVDHNLAMFLLEFWGTYADAFLDTEDSLNLSEASPCIIQVIEIFWNKITLPHPSQHAHWTSDSWDSFYSFRRDFWEFLESTYVLVGTPLFNTLVTNVLHELKSPTPNWEKLESSLASINALSDNISPQITNEYALVAQLLQSPLLEQLSHLDNMHIRTTGVNFIGSFDYFFEDDIGRPFLFPALDYLFKSLSISSLSSTASLSIQKLCSSCRAVLTDALPSFFATYTTLSLYETLENTPHERTVLAISCVIQAVKDVEKKGAYIHQLITLILGQLEKFYTEYDESTSSGGKTPDERLFLRIVSLLRCLSLIGNGLQNITGSITSPVSQQYWDADKFHISSHLLQVVRIFALERPEFKSNVEVCECCCDILKAGGDAAVAPYVFPIDTELEFIKTKYATGPLSCYPTIIGLACSVLGSSAVPPANVDMLLDTFFPDEGTILVGGKYDDHPDLQLANLKLLRQVLKANTGIGGTILLAHTKVELILRFAVQMVGSLDRLVMREAAFFWTSFLEFPTVKSTDVFAKIGPELVKTLVSKVEGDPTRCDTCCIQVIKSLLLEATPAEPFNRIREWFKEALAANKNQHADEIEVQKQTQFWEQIVQLNNAPNNSKDSERSDPRLQNLGF